MKFEHIDLTVVRNGEEKSYTASGSGTESGVSWTISSADDRFSLTLAPSAEIGIKEISASFKFEFLPDDRLFLNGYQSWTDSREYTVNDRMRDLSHIPAALNRLFGFTQYGDYNFVQYGKKKGQLHGFSYAYVRRGDQFILFGSLAENTGYTVIRFDAAAGRMILQKDCAGRRITEPYAVFDLVILSGTEDAVFDKYFELMGIPKATGKRLTGYTSWYNRYENITEQTVLSDLDGFKNAPQTPDVFQIDDGYESAVGDWLSVDPVKFPGGMGAIARRIADAGMLPGIWLAPFAAEKDSRLAKDHPDWLLKDETGQPVSGGGNWSGFYGLDIYNEGVRGYLKRVFDTVLNEWGYGLVKLDFLYAACLVPRHDKTRAEIMLDGMKFLRSLCGNALILGCGVPLASAFGLVDYCRIGCDVSLSWNDKLYMRLFHRERPSTKNTILNTVFRRQLDGRAFRCDPDVFLLRDENIRLSAGQKRTLAVVNALFGGVLFTSDNVAEYSGDAMKLWREISGLSRDNFEGLAFEKNGTLRLSYREGDRNKALYIPR